MFSSQDILVVGTLIFLEGILSIDNALVLAMLAKPLSPRLQRRALTYGIAGAIAFRTVAILVANSLMRWNWVKFVGGAYLLWVAIKGLRGHGGSDDEKRTAASTFWRTVVAIELTDIAFAADSILAAVALTPKYWLVLTGGIIGMILMRFAATLFIRLLERFPSFESAAYWLVFIIGVKLVLDGFHFPGVDFHSSSSGAFWIFWGAMAAAFLSGFRAAKKAKTGASKR